MIVCNLKRDWQITLCYILDGFGTSNSATVCDVESVVAARKVEWETCVNFCTNSCPVGGGGCQVRALCPFCVPKDFVIPAGQTDCCKKRIERIITNFDNQWETCSKHGCLSDEKCFPQDQCTKTETVCDKTKTIRCNPI